MSENERARFKAWKAKQPAGFHYHTLTETYSRLAYHAATAAERARGDARVEALEDALKRIEVGDHGGRRVAGQAKFETVLESHPAFAAVWRSGLFLNCNLNGLDAFDIWQASHNAAVEACAEAVALAFDRDAGKLEILNAIRALKVSK